MHVQYMERVCSLDKMLQRRNFKPTTTTMAAKIKSSKRLWRFFLPIFMCTLMFIYIRNKIGKLHCPSQETFTFSQSVQRFLHRLFGFELPASTTLHYQSQLCDKNIVSLCLYIITVNIPEDVNYWRLELSQDSELKEFIIRLSVVLIIVMCVILCNVYKWKGLTDDDVVVDVSRTRVVQRMPRENNLQSKGQPVGQQSAWTFWRIVGLIFALLTLISIPWEFVRLYQMEVSKRAAQTSAGEPQECFPGGMSIFQSIKAWSQHHFSWREDDPCNKYYYFLLVDPLWELTPLMVLSSAATRSILHPMEQMFSGLGRSFRMFFQEIPAQWQPVVMVIAFLLVLVMMLMKFRYRLSVPMLFRFEPKTPVQDKAEPRKQRKINMENSYIDYYDPTDSYKTGTLFKKQPVSRTRRKKVEKN